VRLSPNINDGSYQYPQISCKILEPLGFTNRIQQLSS
jgi:hypothetical protein